MNVLVKVNQYSYLTLCGTLLLLSELVTHLSAQTCSKASSCSCTTTDGHLINLQPLADIPDANTPLINNQTSRDTTSNATFSYKPCRSFTEGPESTGCKDVAACQNDTQRFYSIGTQNTATFSGDPASDTLVITYTATDGDTKRTSHVHLICLRGVDQTYDVLGEVDTDVYNFTLRTKYACLPRPTGLSTGSVLLIVFFVFVLMYLLLGFLYMRFVSGATGVEQIPNYEFWKEFPLLVKDGVTFTVSGCKTESTYEQI